MGNVSILGLILAILAFHLFLLQCNAIKFLDIGDDDFVEKIVEVGRRHYLNDTGCPINWEPSGIDMLSPCLQEADLMSRILLNDMDFGTWLKKFMSGLTDEEHPIDLKPGSVGIQ